MKIPLTLLFSQDPIIATILIAIIIYKGFELPLSKNIFLFCLTILSFLMYFYRHYPIKIKKDNYIYSPSYGRVLYANDNQVIVYLSPTDIHVQYVPVSGIISRIEYKPGEFNPALSSVKSKFNESCDTEINFDENTVVVSQIAGQLARRIVNWKIPGQAVSAGSQLGMIKFGSQVRTLVSPGFHVLVKPGDYITPDTRLFELEPTPGTISS